MEFHLFDLKNEMVKNGITMLDFHENNFEVNISPFDDLKIDKILILDESYEGRPDLLAFRSGQKTADALDIILKFNQITNPFSIQSGDIIVIPNLVDAQKFYKKEKTSTKTVIDFQKMYIDESKKSTVDSQRIRQLAKIAKRRANGATQIMPTNLLRAGEKAFTIDSNNQTISLSPYNSSK
jgi:NDP-sugar pyrophosphorylase family protein